MNKADVINEVSSKCGYKKKEVKDIVDCFLDSIKNGVENVGYVEIRNFGTFYKSDKKARKIHSPIADKVLDVAPKRVISFKASKSTEKTLN